MKIEICEQMVQSWLFNCEQCEIVQTNWTVSPLREFSASQIDQVNVLMTDIQDKLNAFLNTEIINALQESTDVEALGEYSIEENEIPKSNKKNKARKTTKLNIFKKSTPSQFIKQCEIDVVGVKFNDGVVEKIYLIDTAFHKAGLGYHDAVATVVKKIIRAILVSAVIFGTRMPVSVIFAAPKCGDTLRNDIDMVVKELRKIVASFYTNISIDLYLNEVFAQMVYLPLKKETDSLNNDNDLFMRAMNLAKVSEKFSVKEVFSEKSSSTKVGTSKGSSLASSARCTEDKALEIAAFYMRNKTTFPKMDEIFLNITNQHGKKSWEILKRYGVRGEHSGILITSDIDAEITKASDPLFKKTLEEIKKREL